jgi:nucleotide-binding universal stress UspA family protein
MMTVSHRRPHGELEHAMNPGSIVVGIDGSEAAMYAAQWAVKEAQSREVPLRLVHVIHTDIEPGVEVSVDDDGLDVQYGESVLRIAAEAVTRTGKPVKVETALLRGHASRALMLESREADMVCVGSVGIGRFSCAELGSTAADLAEGACCPVAIIRADHTDVRPGSDWIAVPIYASVDNEAIVPHAMDEARLRGAPVLALGVWRDTFGEMAYGLDKRVQVWRRRYPDVRVYATATRAGVADYLADNDGQVQLAVIGSADADEVLELISPQKQPARGRAECAVLIVRP